MLNHMKGKSKAGWVQQPVDKRKSGETLPARVTFVRTDHIDVSFDDGVRVTLLLEFHEKKLRDVKVVDVIRKTHLDAHKNFFVKNR